MKESDLKAIEAAVRAVEMRTSCEVVPMIVRRSISPESSWRTMFLLFIIGVLAGDGLTALRSVIGENVGALVVALIASALLARFLVVFPRIERLAWSKDVLKSVINDRAELEFYRAGLHGTRGAVGILIFVSLVERRVTILADKGIAEILPASTWDDAVSALTESCRKRDLGNGLVRVIHQVGELLEPRLPRQRDDINELADFLVIREF